MSHRYSEKEQVLILKLIKYFQREKDAGQTLLPLNSVHNRVSDALNVSLRTIQRLTANGLRKDLEYQLEKSLGGVSSHRSPIHQVHEHTIRARIYSMYAAGEHVTVRSLHIKLQTIDQIQLSVGTLANCLKKLKFKWQKCTISHRLYLMEQPYVVQRRLEFLREYKRNETSPFSLKPVALDETWIFSKGGFRRSWQDGTLQTVRKQSEGVRYIVLHAGSEDGFIENASLIFKSGSKSGDYHNSMNCANFEKWFEEKLLPNLEEPSLIIMDNASYHSGLVEKIPNQSWSKSLLVDWLHERDIPFPTLAMRDQIWEIVKKHKRPKRYRLDELAAQHGHRVLRLPPYHCEYNPIELVWSECKRYYDAKISSVHPVTSEAVLGTWREALEKIGPEKWKNYFKHTNEIISKAWEREKLIDASNIMPVIINLNDSDASESSDEDNYYLSDES